MGDKEIYFTEGKEWNRTEQNNWGDKIKKVEKKWKLIWKLRPRGGECSQKSLEMCTASMRGCGVPRDEDELWSVETINWKRWWWRLLLLVVHGRYNRKRGWDAECVCWQQWRNGVCNSKQLFPFSRDAFVCPVSLGVFGPAQWSVHLTSLAAEDSSAAPIPAFWHLRPEWQRFAIKSRTLISGDLAN